jgi:MSHA biogenesis protein MshP
MRPERGFALVAALFVMVIIALVVVAMARLSTVQHGTNSLAIQQARAYQAARAGLEWGIAQTNGAACAANQTVSLAGSSLADFTLQVACTATTYSENGAALTIYRLTATAQNGTPGARPDYAYRQLAATVER